MAAPVRDPPGLEPGETLLATWRPDPGRYWRDHGVLAAVGAAGAGAVLWALSVPQPGFGVLGAALAVGVRAAWLRGETLALAWHLTDRRLLLPGGRAVALLEIETQRRLLGDVQLITRSGDKHLLKHIADADAVLARLGEARARRARRAARG